MNFKLQSSVYPPLAWKISRASFSVCSSFCSRTASVFSSLYIHRLSLSLSLSLSPSNSPRSTRTAGACCILVRGHVGHAAERPDTVLREAQHGGQRVQCAQEQRQGLVLRGVQCGLAVGRVHELGVAAADRRIDHRILTDHQRTSAIIEVHLAETTPLRPGPACKIAATPESRVKAFCGSPLRLTGTSDCCAFAEQPEEDIPRIASGVSQRIAEYAGE